MSNHTILTESEYCAAIESNTLPSGPIAINFGPLTPTESDWLTTRLAPVQAHAPQDKAKLPHHAVDSSLHADNFPDPSKVTDSKEVVKSESLEVGESPFAFPFDSSDLWSRVAGTGSFELANWAQMHYETGFSYADIRQTLLDAVSAIDSLILSKQGRAERSKPA